MDVNSGKAAAWVGRLQREPSRRAEITQSPSDHLSQRHGHVFPRKSHSASEKLDWHEDAGLRLG